LELKEVELSQRNNELEQTNVDMMTDRENYKKREGERLEFTQKVTNKNSLLQSENMKLRSEVCVRLDGATIQS